MVGGKGKRMVGGYRGNTASQNTSSGASKPWKPKKPPLTHFLCFPLVTTSSRPQLEASLHRFTRLLVDPSISGEPELSQDDVRSRTTGIATFARPESRRVAASSLIPAKAIRPVGTLHFTLGVMSLLEREQLEGAVRLLNHLDLEKLLEEPQQIAVESDNREPARSEIQMSSMGADRHDRMPDPTSASVDYDRPGRGAASSIVTSSLKSLARSITPPSRVTTSSIEDSATPSIVSTGPIVVSLQSLHPMQSPRATSVLYAAPDPTDRLLHLGSQLRSIFQQQGYLVPDPRPLKLHATIVNTIYAKDGGRRGHGRRGPRTAPQDQTDKMRHMDGSTAPDSKRESIDDDDEQRPDGAEAEQSGAAKQNSDPDTRSGHSPHSKAPLRFDATALIEQFKDFVWAENVRIERIAICKMGAKKVYGPTGDLVSEEYEEVASIQLP